MDLVGYVYILGVRYPLAYTSFNKASRMWLLLDPDKNYVAYLQGDTVLAEDVIEMLDTGQQRRIGQALVLQRVLQELSDFKIKCVLNHDPVSMGTVAQYTDSDGNRLYLHGMNYAYIDYKTKTGIIIYLEQCHAFRIDKKGVRDRSEPIELDQTKTSVSQFLDSTMESLELRGYNFDWLKEKTYVSVQTMEEVNTVLLPHLKRCLQEAKAKNEKLLVTLDFESTGLNAFDERCPARDTATFVGISFEDHTGYGLFLGMEHFENLPVPEVAELFTHLFSRDILADRDISILGTLFKRSDIIVSGHNIMIDIRFGLTVNMDIWFNMCSMQVGFNLDPFLTKGHNGAKDRARQFYDIDYPELGETAGKGFYGHFNRFSDKRVIMMYGCADVDLVRMYTARMLEQIPKLEPYFGVDQIKQFYRLDEVYMNMKARFDYMGMRVNKDLARQRAKLVESKIKTIHDFLAYYVPRAELTVTYLSTLKHAEDAGRDISVIAPPNLDEVDALKVDKWSGDFLISVLFKKLAYDILFWTESDDPKKRKPKLDKEAIKDYLLHGAKIVYPEKVTTLEEYSIKGKYLARDIHYDDGTVAISSEKFNSFQYPLFYVLSILGPLEKEMSADFAPLLLDDSDYRYVDTRTTTIVTRRDVSPLSTVKGSNKDLYLAYDPDEYYILDADQAAVEIRIAFGLSEDDTIIKPLENPESDPHIETAAQMFGKQPFLIDRKTERNATKWINFGRIYRRGAYSICKQINGVVTKALKAATEALLALFDRDKASVHRVLDQYRKRAIQKQEVPEWLGWFLKMDEGTDYGKMDNTFGFVQHVNLSRDEPWYIPMMERKAGNFAVQGLAANLLRIVYTRFVERCWARGWIQDKRIIIHTTIYDEILLSFHKSLNPFELLAVLREAFVVRYRKFPPLFIGANIARSWGDTKDDKYEIPSILLETYMNDFKAGKSPELPEGTDYVQWFLKDIVRYKMDRIKLELAEKGFDKSQTLNLEHFSERFTSYYVRSLLLEFKGFLFAISDYSDPVEVLASTLLHFISKNILEDGDILKVKLRGKLFGITSKTNSIYFASESDLIHGIKPEAPVPENKILHASENDEDDDTFYTFNELEEDFYVEGEMTLTSWILPSDYDPASLKLTGIKEPARYKNFNVRAGSAVIAISNQEQIIKLKNFLLGKATTSTDSVNVFFRYRLQNKLIGRFKEAVLVEMDKKEELWT